MSINSQLTFRLLDLPVELQQHVFEIVLLDCVVADISLTCEKVPYPGESIPSVDVSGLRFGSAASTPLLVVNKYVHRLVKSLMVKLQPLRYTTG